MSSVETVLEELRSYEHAPSDKFAPKEERGENFFTYITTTLIFTDDLVLEPALTEFFTSDSFNHFSHELKTCIAFETCTAEASIQWLCANGDDEDVLSIAWAIATDEEIRAVINRPFVKNDENIIAFYRNLKPLSRLRFLQLFEDKTLSLEVLSTMVACRHDATFWSEKNIISSRLKQVLNLPEDFPFEWVLQAIGEK